MKSGCKQVLDVFDVGISWLIMTLTQLAGTDVTLEFTIGSIDLQGFIVSTLTINLI